MGCRLWVVGCGLSVVGCGLFLSFRFFDAKLLTPNELYGFHLFLLMQNYKKKTNFID